MSTNTRTTVKSAHARMDALETSIDARFDRLEALITALVPASEPAMVVTPAPAEPEAPANEFVGWLRETAEQRHARKTSNREMAAWLREKGLPTNGPVWEAAKKGERSMRVLRKLAK